MSQFMESTPRRNQKRRFKEKTKTSFNEHNHQNTIRLTILLKNCSSNHRSGRPFVELQVVRTEAKCPIRNLSNDKKQYSIINLERKRCYLCQSGTLLKLFQRHTHTQKWHNMTEIWLSAYGFFRALRYFPLN